MGFRFLISTLLTVIVAGSASADKHYFITADYSLRTLENVRGNYWGRHGDKMFLTGGEETLANLRLTGARFEFSSFDGERSELYLVFSNETDGANLLFAGSEYYISATRPDRDLLFRIIRHCPLPRAENDPYDNMLLTYDPLIDEMIGQVATDTIMDYLARLSGALPINIDGRTDTIHTRYSGTEDNSLAAEYLKQVLENYGYQTEFHGFYGGTIRHSASYGENMVWMVTENSEILRSSDGGASWQSIDHNTSASLWGVANQGPDLVWIVGDAGTILFSENGGESFGFEDPGVGSFLFGVSFINTTQGWVAGDFGTVIHTIDSGRNWSTQTTPTSSRLYDICFVDSLNGWACGRSGTIIHTTNGGENWTTQSSGTSQRLYGIEFTDPDNGWCVGWGGVVRNTTNGGATWTTVNLGSMVEKYHVEFVDSQFGCIVGWQGEIFITTDGGANWEQKSSGTSSDLYGVTFADNMTGYADGNGAILKTTDGGDTWYSQTQNVESAWRNVIATKEGTTDPDQQVVICAHMDNRSQYPETNAPGSDDNGSGTIAVVEAARIFTQYEFEKTVKFCLWTGEEQGLMGSAAYANDAAARGDDIVGVFNFDMIAWDGNGDGSSEFHTGTENPSIALGNIMTDVVTDYDLSLNPDIITWGATGASDHASFWDVGYAAVLGIEDYSSDFNPYYHTTGDNMDHLMADFFTDFTKVAIGASAALAIPDTATTGVESDPQLPAGYTLSANYPNPFNAATTISFSVPVSGNADLSVYDIMGRKVATLYSGRVNAGTHRVTWNANEKSSGVYFYRLTAGEVDATGRMTLLK